MLDVMCEDLGVEFSVGSKKNKSRLKYGRQNTLETKTFSALLSQFKLFREQTLTIPMCNIVCEL